MVDNIIIIEDQQLVRDSLACLLNGTQKFAVTSAVGTVAEAQALLARPHDISLILCDYNLKQETAIKLLQEQRFAKDIPIVVLTSVFNAVKIQPCLSAGARGFLFKESSIEEFVKGIETVLAGGTYFSLPETDSIHLESHFASTDPDIRLTNSELETLRWVATGMSNKQIARTLGKSSETIKTHITKIFQKLKCSNRTQAVSKAVQLNLIDQLD